MHNHACSKYCWFAVFILAVLPAFGAAEEIRLPAIADVGISAAARETSASMGRTPLVRLKSIQELALVDFDVRPLRQKRIAAAWLHMRTSPESAQRELARLQIDKFVVPPSGGSKFVVPPSGGSSSKPIDLLRNIGISTISSPWVEGEQDRSYQPDPRGHGATFEQASSGREPWAWEGSRVTDVILGNGNSVHSHAPLVREADYWWKVPIDPAVIETLVAGGGYGIAVLDETGLGGNLGANNDVYTRESNRWVPYLTVEVNGEDAEPPPAPTELAVAPAPEKATLSHGAIRVELVAPEGAAAYRVYVNGRRLEPWQVARPPAGIGWQPVTAEPKTSESGGLRQVTNLYHSQPTAGPGVAQVGNLSQPGTKQSFIVTDLVPRMKAKVEIEAVDGAGNISPRATAEGVVSPVLAPVPPLPLAPQPRGGEPPVASERMRVWAFPELAKVDPLTGEAMDEPDGATYPRANAVWDGAARKVRLVAARGEIVGFQVAVDRLGASLEGVRVALEPLTSIGGTIGPDRFRLWRAWYVRAADQRWHAELALPHDKPFDVPARDNAVVGQRNQTVWVDIAVPGEARPGLYKGTVIVSAESVAAPIRLAVELEVANVEMPREINFAPELNAYATPGEPGSDYFYEAHRLAHYHRCTLVTVPYSQGGNILHKDLAPVLAGEDAGRPQQVANLYHSRPAGLRVADWSGFDRVFGPLLDGSAFADNPRAGVPIKYLYLPFHENWPVPMAGHYAFPGRPSESTLWAHQLAAPPIDEAFDAAYKQGWMNVAREFAAHFEEKNWDRTFAFCFFNNKNSFKNATSWWNFDEPWSRDDFLALRFFARLWREATAGATGVHLLFRADISRPQWQGDLLDGLVDAEYVSGLFDRERTDQLLAERMPALWSAYGACNEVGEPNVKTAAWCLRAFVENCRGVVPWNSLDNEGKSFREPNPTGLIVNGKEFGYGPIASFRVFALRRGAQDAELLRLLALQRKWQPMQAGVFASKRVPLVREIRPKIIEDATASRFDRLSSRGFCELKQALVELAK